MERDRSSLGHGDLAIAGHAPGYGRGPGRRRPVWRGPLGQPAAGADRRIARQGGCPLRAERHDGQSDRPQDPDPTRATRSSSATRRISSGMNRAPRQRIPACSSPSSAVADYSPRPICGPPTSRPGHIVFPPTTVVAVENTHNRGGGVVFPQAEAVAICETTRELGLASYLDGARLFNAAAATGRSLAELAAPFDVVSVALSKGLGCPVGSLIAGSYAGIVRARRARRMFGGAMRQSGILAAAGLYALDHNLVAARRRPRQCAAHRGTAGGFARRTTSISRRCRPIS